jgi:prophage regulatory protein
MQTPDQIRHTESPAVSIDPLLKRPKVEELTGLSTSAIYAAVARGTFPKPVKIGAKAVAWRSSAVSAWINSREESAA